MKRTLIVSLVALAVLLAGCGSGEVTAEATPTPYPTPVKATFTTQRGDITVEAKFNGRVTPLALSTVFFQINGQVSEVYANVNDVVKKGQLLGELAEAQELKAKADETQHTIRRAQIKLEIAQLTLEEYKAQNRPSYEVIVDLEASTGDDQIKEMYEGLPVTVTLDDKPDVKLTGTIRQLPSPYGTGPSDEHAFHVVLDTKFANQYQTGDKVRVIVQLASKQSVLWLPPDAIRQAGGRTFVIVNSDNGPKRVDIEIGLQTRDMVEIISGLEESQVVVGP